MAAEPTPEEQLEALTVEIGRWNREVVENLRRARAEGDWSVVDDVIEAAVSAEQDYIAAQLLEP